jgi:hypothetical protein
MNCNTVTLLSLTERGGVVREVDDLDLELGWRCTGALRGHCERWSDRIRRAEEK